MTITANVRWVYDELRRRGYPFGRGRDARAQWARDEMLHGRLERNAITEKMAAKGLTPNQIGQIVGIPGERVMLRLVTMPPPEVDDVVLHRGGPPSDLAAYRIHVEKFGPELVLETATSDLSVDELGQLAAFIDSMERAYRWKNGEWAPRR
jgi:hypothetical protein